MEDALLVLCICSICLGIIKLERSKYIGICTSVNQLGQNGKGYFDLNLVKMNKISLFTKQKDTKKAQSIVD